MSFMARMVVLIGPLRRFMQDLIVGVKRQFEPTDMQFMLFLIQSRRCSGSSSSKCLKCTGIDSRFLLQRGSKLDTACLHDCRRWVRRKKRDSIDNSYLSFLILFDKFLARAQYSHVLHRSLLYSLSGCRVRRCAVRRI
jgi:hypothetical protein